MVRHVSSRALGLFVTLGVVIAIAVIIWIGASKYFEKGDRYVTYFDESVQGLQRDSAVKYRGVDVGRIEDIRVAPDNRLIEVVMKINLKEDVEKNSVAYLRVAGITGIVFIELDRKDPESPDLSPKLDFASQYPIIPSRPSQIRQIFSGIDEIIEKIKKLDLEELANSFKATGKSAENLFGGPQMMKTLQNLESISTSIDQTAARIEKMTAGGKLEGILDDTRTTLAEARSLISTTRDEIKALKLADTAEKTNRVMDNLSRTSRTTARDIQAMSDSLKRTSESLERLVDRLEANPSDLLFSSPPPEGRRD
jgi:phospholipid/cholesterol/gamma-HCH transport system substrate-binding protein